MNSGTKLGGHAINLSGFGSPFAGPKVSWPSLPSSWLALVKNYFKLTSAWAFQSASDYNALFCTVERGEEGSYLYTISYMYLLAERAFYIYRCAIKMRRMAKNKPIHRNVFTVMCSSIKILYTIPLGG